ncbi:MAG: hypothetical protein NC037_02985 [Bacteroides sp.]|nr:hypothetical protein [Muribaculaceae bacterium]MCM1455479.1 hypothetical protein [Bacteroides sp.]
MKKVTIEQNTFKAMIEGVKHAVSTDNCRPILQYIRVVVTPATVTFYALDGFQAAKLQIEHKNDCDFACYIKPIKFTPLKNGAFTVDIEFDEETRIACVNIRTEYGELVYKFTQPAGEFIDIEKVYADAREHDRELGISAGRVAKALNSIIKTTSDREHGVIFESKENCQTAFILRSIDKNILNEQLILPIRIFSDER